MAKKAYKNSLAAKIEALKEDESIVVFGEGYKKTMRYICSMQSRGYVDKSVSYKKATVIVDDVLTIGCLIMRSFEDETEE